jgi:diacylglycerol kinase family enzyme
VHEVIKGIYELESRPQTVKLWIIPCGSGNALATSVGVYSPEDGISRFLTKEPLRKLVIYNVSMSFNDQLTFLDYCFCVLSFGFHTQIIRQSEWLRFMGAFRFQV